MSLLQLSTPPTDLPPHRPATLLEKLLGHFKPLEPIDTKVINWPATFPALTGLEKTSEWLTIGTPTCAILNDDSKVTTFLPFGSLQVYDIDSTPDDTTIKPKSGIEGAQLIFFGITMTDDPSLIQLNITWTN